MGNKPNNNNNNNEPATTNKANNEDERGRILWNKCDNGDLKLEDMLTFGSVIDWKNPAFLNWTALHVASRYAKPSAVEILLRSNANVNSTAIDNQTPLYLASHNGKESIVGLLLKNEADINFADKCNRTSLHAASVEGYELVVSLLLKNGAATNLTDEDGATPLFLACWNGHVKVIALLLQHQADINIKNNKGMDALARAEQCYDWVKPDDKAAMMQLLSIAKKAEVKTPRPSQKSGQSTQPQPTPSAQTQLSQSGQRQPTQSIQPQPTQSNQPPTHPPNHNHPGQPFKKPEETKKVLSISKQSSSNEIRQWATPIIGEDSELLYQNKIDGEELMDLTETDLLKILPLGSVRKLIRRINEMKGSQQDPTLTKHPIIPYPALSSSPANAAKRVDSIYTKMQNDTTSIIGIPLSLFPPNYPSPTITIHKAISLAMTPHWNERIQTDFKTNLNYFIENSISFEEEKNKYDLTIDEACAITYYTMDASKLLSSSLPKTMSPYYTLNKALVKRDQHSLEQWKPFLYFLMNGLKKIGNTKTTVYRAIDVSLLAKPNTQYKLNSTVVWVGFTSTTKNKEQLSNFTEESKTGTWMILEVVEGKDISPFSIFSKEEEVLLMPNSYFKVETHITNEMKGLLNINVNVDVLQLKQQQTPDQFKSMIVKSYIK